MLQLVLQIVGYGMHLCLFCTCAQPSPLGCDANTCSGTTAARLHEEYFEQLGFSKDSSWMMKASNAIGVGMCIRQGEG